MGLCSACREGRGGGRHKQKERERRGEGRKEENNWTDIIEEFFEGLRGRIQTAKRTRECRGNKSGKLIINDKSRAKTGLAAVS